ncbi:hypothetical protein EES40_14620 [Streptomyces sp. ADI93-02]|nr:hypothetical protein EES40_14620 [Streptomyces sp. ADI93-02]
MESNCSTSPNGSSGSGEVVSMAVPPWALMMHAWRDGEWRTCRRAEVLGLTGTIARRKGFFRDGEADGETDG